MNNQFSQHKCVALRYKAVLQYPTEYEEGWENGYSDGFNDEAIDTDLGGAHPAHKLGYRDGFIAARVDYGPLPEPFSDAFSCGNKREQE